MVARAAREHIEGYTLVITESTEVVRLGTWGTRGVQVVCSMLKVCRLYIDPGAYIDSQQGINLRIRGAICVETARTHRMPRNVCSLAFKATKCGSLGLIIPPAS
jgi:hypothetical protein